MATRKKKVPAEIPETKPVEKKPQAPHLVRQVVEVIAEEDVPVNDGVDMPTKEADTDIVSAVAAPAGEEKQEPMIHNAMDASEDVPDLLADEKEEAVSSLAEAPAISQSPVEEEKRKEMVDELFQPEQSVPDANVPQRAAPSAVMPDISVHKKRSVPLLVWVLIVIVVAALTGGGILFATKGGSAIALVAKPTPTPTPAQPTPTPTPVAVDKKAVKIEVLNGSGVTGAAKKMKTLLEEKGYVVEKTGNAAADDVAQTEIHVKANKDAYIAALEEDLKDSYTIGTKAADLSDDSPYDVAITIGKE